MLTPPPKVPKLLLTPPPKVLKTLLTPPLKAPKLLLTPLPTWLPKLKLLPNNSDLIALLRQ